MSGVIADTRKATQHWEHRSDPLPYLMVPMSDGSTVRYNPEVQQPRPFLKKALDKFTDLCIGYKWKETEQ